MSSLDALNLRDGNSFANPLIPWGIGTGHATCLRAGNAAFHPASCDKLSLRLVCKLCANAAACFRSLLAFRSCFRNGALPTTCHGLPPWTTLSRISLSGRTDIMRRTSSKSFGLMPCSLCYRNRSELRSFGIRGMMWNPARTYRHRTVRVVFAHRRRSIRAAIAPKSRMETPMSRGLY